jgi:hypothetical protein
MLRDQVGRLGLCALLLLLIACGRVGVHLIPLEDPLNRRDAGANPDSGTIELDSGMIDSGGAGGGMTDAMTSEPDAAMSCPVVCQNDHGAADCGGGSCTLTCEIGYADCDTDPSTGCEQGTISSIASCGGCGRSCTNAHGATSCDEGLCVPSCATGFADCDADAANGCETDLGQPASCGGCGRGCTNAHGTTACAGGTCTPACAAGYADCDGNPDNGCEANTDDDPMHCGSCTDVCNPSTQYCSMGSCQVNPCSAGLGECDSNPVVACETDLTSSVANCGFCGNQCMLANATASCSMSACAVSSCDSGYGNCDSTAANGCEVPLATTTTHCGDCATGCTNGHGTTSCVASTCTPSCSAGYGDCDASRPNGCETQLNTVSNCGMCGMSCPANGGTPQCNSGVCTTVCDLTGTYALKLSVPANWPATTVLAAGNGTFTFWALVRLTQSGTSLTGSVAPCGENVVDFASTPFINEKYGVTFPSTIFDRTPLLPSTSSTGTLGTTNPGSSFSFGRASYLVGAILADPNNGAWPNRTATTSQDGDMDGKPGVTAPYKTGSGYSYVPTTTLAMPRANRGYLATRLMFTLGGTLMSCTEATGSATAHGLNSHTLGCRRADNNQDCSSGQADYLDSNAPGYQVSSAMYTLRKIDAADGCAEVRTELP